MTAPVSPSRSQLASDLRELAERLPRPYEEDRFYSQREQNRLNADIAIVNAAATALESIPSETAPIEDDLPLNCKAVDGALDMRIGTKILAFAAENHPDLWDAEKDRGRFKVTDPVAFAQEVERALNRESEDGSTMLTRMLDAAVLEAIEQGGEGVEGE